MWQVSVYCKTHYQYAKKSVVYDLAFNQIKAMMLP